MTIAVTVTAHRNCRGPFTAAGNILRALTDQLLARPDLTRRYDVEILTVAPEFARHIVNHRETQTSSIAPRLRTRYYPAAWITRISHGITELINRLAEDGVVGSITATDVDHADPTDAEFLRILLRRGVPSLTVNTQAGHPAGPVEDAPIRDLARRYVDGDGIDSDNRLVAAYQQLTAAQRADLHDRRAAQLRELIDDGEISLTRWTLAWHAERGSDPSGAGVAALTEAIEVCVLNGFYDAVVEHGTQLLSYLRVESGQVDDKVQQRWLVTAKLTLALSVLGRLEEAEAAYDQAQAATTDPSTHLQSYYGRAMLLTRYAEPDRRDHQRAKSVANTAITIASLLPDEIRRAFNTTFNENGLALVEMHLGNLHESLALVERGIARLDAPGHDRNEQHRWVLIHNRAQLLTALDRLDESLACYPTLLAVDPNYSEYHLDLASTLRRMGRFEEADHELTEAIRLSPPYPEPVFNRGDLRAARGQLQAAAADFRYVLELDPQFPSARMNLAGLLIDVGDFHGARTVAQAGLRLNPRDAALRTVIGQVAHELGDRRAAADAYDAALTERSDYVPALVARACLHYERDNLQSLTRAISDLERAAELSESPDIADNLQLARDKHTELAAQSGAPSHAQSSLTG